MNKFVMYSKSQLFMYSQVHRLPSYELVYTQENGYLGGIIQESGSIDPGIVM